MKASEVVLCPTCCGVRLASSGPLHSVHYIVNFILCACRWYRRVCSCCAPEEGNLLPFVHLTAAVTPAPLHQHNQHALPQAKANRSTKDLEKRERELDKREKALAAREAKLAESGTRSAGRDVSVSLQAANRHFCMLVRIPRPPMMAE